MRMQFSLLGLFSVMTCAAVVAWCWPIYVEKIAIIFNWY
jgi:hypothetical protein